MLDRSDDAFVSIFTSARDSSVTCETAEMISGAALAVPRAAPTVPGCSIAADEPGVRSRSGAEADRAVPQARGAHNSARSAGLARK